MHDGFKVKSKDRKNVDDLAYLSGRFAVFQFSEEPIRYAGQLRSLELGEPLLLALRSHERSRVSMSQSLSATRA